MNTITQQILEDLEHLPPPMQEEALDFTLVTKLCLVMPIRQALLGKFAHSHLLGNAGDQARLGSELKFAPS